MVTFFFQVYLVAARIALQLGNLYLRRSEKVPSEKKTRWLAGTGNLLLTSTFHHLSNSYHLFHYLSPRIALPFHTFSLPRSLRLTSARNACYCFVRILKRASQLSHRCSPTEILASFIFHNHFVCMSCNKWVYRTIPVR